MALTEPPPGLVEQALAPDDAGALVPLATDAGWNQIAADWRFMLQLGSGVGMRDGEGRWVASALSLPVGPHLSWVSMVLTNERWRRRGIGGRLLRHCIEEVRRTGRAAGLDATEFGRPVYLGLGFRDLYSVSRWRVTERPAAIAAPDGLTLRAMQSADLAAVAGFDAARSAMQRRPVLEHLHSRAPTLAFLAERDGRIAGFVLGRDGNSATHIGPVVADDVGVAQALASRAMSELGPPYLIDAPDHHEAIMQWLQAANAHAPRSYTRMVLGDAGGLDDARAIFAIAGPELG
jgi:ribosomal protein S18 acetylase RimI-like enzyme